MRQISRVDIGVLVLCLFLCVASTAEAQSTGKSAQRSTQPQQQQPVVRQAANPGAPAKNAPADDGANPKSSAERRPKFHAVDNPALDAILKRWETESAKIKTLQGKQTRSEYNTVFKVKKVTKGDFFFETPDKGRIDMLATPVKKGQTAKKKTENGTEESYEVASGDSMKWICTGDTIVSINDDEKTYRTVEIPPNQRGSNIVHSPLPFLFGMKAAEAKSRFDLTLADETDETATLIVIPLMEKDAQNYAKAKIMLSKETYLPIAVLLWQTGNMETLYVFEKPQVNKKSGGIATIFTGEKDPYRPNLKSYKLVVENDDPYDIQPARGSAPEKDPKKPVNDSAPLIPRRTQSANGQKPGTMK